MSQAASTLSFVGEDSILTDGQNLTPTPLARHGGLSRAEVLAKTEASSVPKCLTLRELGGTGHRAHYSRDLINTVVKRHLVKSRHPLEPAEPLPAEPGSKKPKKSENAPPQRLSGLNGVRVRRNRDTETPFLTLTADGGSGCNINIVMVEDRIFVRESKGQTYECLAYDHQQVRMGRKYWIPTKGNWKNWDLSYPPDQPFLATTVQKHGQKLWTLEPPGHRLSAYDFESGLRLYDQLLDPEIKYHQVDVSGELNRVLLQSVKASLPAALTFDCIMIGLDDFRPRIRWQMLKSVIPAQASVEQIDNMVYLNYGHRIELSDLSDALKGFESGSSCIPLSSDSPVPVSHLVSQKPVVLFAIQTCHSYFDVSEVGYPPHYITSAGEGQFRVYDSGHGELVKNHDLTLLSGHEEDTVHFHPDGSSRLIMTGQNSCRVVSIQRRSCPETGSSKSELVEEFHVVFSGEGKGARVVCPLTSGSDPAGELRVTQEPAVSGRQSSRRASRPLRYGRLEEDPAEDPGVLIYFQYVPTLEALAFMEVSESGLQFTFYDNHSFSRLFSASGAGLQIKSLKDAVRPNIFSFSVSVTHITVRRDKSDTGKSLEELLIIPLLHESKVH